MKTTTLQGPPQLVSRSLSSHSPSDWRQLARRPARWLGRITHVPTLIGATCSRMRRRASTGLGEVDARTGLYNFEGLMDASEALLEAANAEYRPLTIVVLEFADLREVRDMYDHATCTRLINRLVRKMDAVAGLGGLAGRTGVTQFTLVIPGSHVHAQQRLRRILGKPARIEFETAASEIVLVPELMLASTTRDTQSIQEVWLGMCKELSRARANEERRQHYLQRERERHSRPMPVS